MQVHTMQQIADAGMTPVAAAATAINSGKTTAGFTLYEAFAVGAMNDARVQVISGLCAQGLTCEEFDGAVTESIAQGAAADKLSCWTPAPNAKGRDKYGPKQNTMTQRATEMRQIFGYLKLTDAAMHAGGYLETLKVARAYLKEHALLWTGAKAPTQEQKADKAATAALAGATKKAMLSTPKVPGEEAGQWFARVAVEAQKLAAEEANKAKDGALQKLAEGLVSQHDVLDVYRLGLALVSYAIRSGAIDKAAAHTDVEAIELPEEPAIVPEGKTEETPPESAEPVKTTRKSRKAKAAA